MLSQGNTWKSFKCDRGPMFQITNLNRNLTQFRPPEIHKVLSTYKVLLHKLESQKWLLMYVFNLYHIENSIIVNHFRQYYDKRYCLVLLMKGRKCIWPNFYFLASIFPIHIFFFHFYCSYQFPTFSFLKLQPNRAIIVKCDGTVYHIDVNYG